jgi:hypothetical protein
MFFTTYDLLAATLFTPAKIVVDQTGRHFSAKIESNFDDGDASDCRCGSPVCPRKCGDPPPPKK